MARPLARPHSLRIEDSIWNVLVEHVARREESASQFTNAVLRKALNMVPKEADQYMARDPEVLKDVLTQASAEHALERQLGSIGFKQTVHPGDPYEDIDLGETTAADYTKPDVPELDTNRPYEDQF